MSLTWYRQPFWFANTGRYRPASTILPDLSLTEHFPDTQSRRPEEWAEGLASWLTVRAALVFFAVSLSDHD